MLVVPHSLVSPPRTPRGGDEIFIGFGAGYGGAVRLGHLRFAVGPGSLSVLVRGGPEGIAIILLASSVEPIAIFAY